MLDAVGEFVQYRSELDKKIDEGTKLLLHSERGGNNGMDAWLQSKLDTQMKLKEKCYPEVKFA